MKAGAVTAAFVAAIVLGGMPGWLLCTLLGGTALWAVFRPH
jgi:F0F1-type ATP synthase assembly protein I